MGAPTPDYGAAKGRRESLHGPLIENDGEVPPTPSTRSLAASAAASTVSAAAGLFGNIMLLVGGVGGTITAFIEHGFIGAVIFLIVWGVIGATLWGVGLAALSVLLSATTYGLVWLVNPDSWPPVLRWIMVIPAGIIGYVLATLLNVVFRLVEALLPLNGLTAIGSLFFVSFFQPLVAIIAASWIAPTAKHTVRVVFCTIFCLLAILLFVLTIQSNVSYDIPRPANLIGIIISAVGAVVATIRVTPQVDSEEH